MNTLFRIALYLLALPLVFAAEPMLPAGAPMASVDLNSADGLRLLQAEWRYSDTRVVETRFPAAGAEGQPTGPLSLTYDIEPKAGAADFDDSGWERIAAGELQKRRGAGRLSFNWYRLQLTVPERVGDFATRGATAIFETSIDDYAEIWVNGELPRLAGQSGGSVVAGWNGANRIVAGRNLKPGDKIQLAIFGINGPISSPPTNFIWMRYAKLEFFADQPTGPFAVTPREVNIEVERKDPAVDAIISHNPKLFKLAEGFTFTEGPVWVPKGKYLLFSDPNENRIWKYTAVGELSEFRKPSGYAGADVAEYKQPGSNGLALDRNGTLVINQHGNRRVVRLNGDGAESVIADRFEGKRLNSPNDLVYRSDGTLFFTDPPFGLPKVHDDPRRELPFFGVFSLRDGKLQVIEKQLRGPNGIALSPDEKYLYVGNWDEKKKVVMRYEVLADGSTRNGKLFFDMTAAPGEDAIDGVKVDQSGNVYISGPGGIWIVSPEGKHLGTIITPMHAHNMAWGDDDGRTLYLTARSALYRIRLNIPGAGRAQ